MTSLQLVNINTKPSIKEDTLMSKRFLIKLGAPLIALSLIAACGTDDEPDPIENDEEAPLAPEDEAPLNQEDDNGNQNPAEDNGNNGDNGMMEDNENDDGLDDPAEELQEEGFNPDDEEGNE